MDKTFPETGDCFYISNDGNLQHIVVLTRIDLSLAEGKFKFFLSREDFQKWLENPKLTLELIPSTQH